ncbi:MAG TPA: type II secretion system F family protein [Gaiellaceae bacterium]|nr:type II secretion system F family protein [Gaiellaceae bacterium]
MIWTLIIAGGAVALAFFLLMDVATLPARERSGSIRRAAGYGKTRTVSSSTVLDDGTFKDRALVPMKTSLARVVLRITPRASVETVSNKLLRAGLNRKVSPTGYLASKGILALVGFISGQVLASVAGALASKALLLGFVGALVGFMFPDTIVTMKTRGRKEVLRAELPDALDLLAVSVEAGMGFDGAISKLTEHMDGPLADEFALALGEMRIGESRQNALTKMMKRVETPEFSAFVRAIIQADQLGISLGRILKVQANDTRQRRQLAAEERAMKAPIKMLFPTVIFIFPAMFIVILGPAFMNLSELF